MKGIALLTGIIGAAVLVSAFCAFGPGRADATEEQVVVIAPVQPAYARQIDMAFEGGRARVGLLDKEAAMEFAERQPLSIQLERKPERIVVAGVPDGVFQGTRGGVEAPVIGDVVLDVQAKEVYICCRDMDASDGRVLLGHVTSGIEPLSRMDGAFEAFAMAAEDL